MKKWAQNLCRVCLGPVGQGEGDENGPEDGILNACGSIFHERCFRCHNPSCKKLLDATTGFTEGPDSGNGK